MHLLVFAAVVLAGALALCAFLMRLAWRLEHRGRMPGGGQ